MSRVIRDARRRVLHGVTKVRGLLPQRVSDAIFHLPDTLCPDARSLAAAEGWRSTDLGPHEIRLPEVMEGSSPEILAALERGVRHPAPGARLFAVEVPRARVLGQTCTAIAPGGCVLEDISPDIMRDGRPHRAVSTRLFAQPPRRLGGRIGLAGDVGHKNIYLWMFDILPRIELVRAAGFGEIDRWILPQSNFPVAGELLARCGVPAESQERLGYWGHVECETLVATSPAGFRSHPTPRSVEYLRSVLRPSASIVPGATAGGTSPPSTRRIYIGRRGRRRLVNESELIAALSPLGFETVYFEGLTLQQQIDAVAGASCIVATHGAGLAHIIHAAPGASLIEFLTPEYPKMTFFLLAGACRMRYGCIEVKGVKASSGNAAARDIAVSVPATVDLVRRATGD
ncbi:MAG: glycosyltransferase family 61 protein [Planctomycetota bacterium]|nr:glycosyltransferase family 61 protein [Planctomycetota bacterium]MDA1106207.1 glycosyltransferase family 61 protein [Planctomycetota bacterium]